MNLKSERITAKELFEENERKDLVRLVTVGSVDDGKSTLIGRLLYDSKTLYEDHLSSLEEDSGRRGSAGDEIDYALLCDGLKAEREQGITIDVAYRYFSTPKRNFIIADCPGHEQYTRNAVTGASNAELAVILIDAAQGVLQQTKRHSFILSLLGINHLVIAVNKMDTVDYRKEVFDSIREDFIDFSERLEIPDIHFLPISALKGDNVVKKSENMPWFDGQPFIEYLETIQVTSDRNLVDLRFPVQYVIRPDADFRGYAGTLASGILRTGAQVMALPSGRRTRVKSILTYDGALEEAFPPMSVTVSLEDELDISRGDMLVHLNNTPHTGRLLEAMVVWMNDRPLREGARYRIKHLTRTITAEVMGIRYKIDVNTLHSEPARELGLNDIGRVVLRLHSPLHYDPYALNRTTGAFIVIDPISNLTMAGGMILDRRPNELTIDPLLQRKRAATDVHPQKSEITREQRAERTQQKAATVWLTGLPKSGKSTIAYRLERQLFDMGYLPHVIDGENLRLNLSNDLGFTANDRSENIRRAAAVAQLCNAAGLISIVALVSPYRSDRASAREMVGAECFIEAHVQAPLEVCEERDTENLYSRARSGELENFSGISAPYEEPEEAEITLTTAEVSPGECVRELVHLLQKRGIIAEI